VIDTFDSAAFLEGALVDVSADPPFTIGQLDLNTGLPDPSSFGGPTTASSDLQNPIIPEPCTLLFTGFGASLIYTRVTRRNPRRLPSYS
jgi:hypothetical protein